MPPSTTNTSTRMEVSNLNLSGAMEEKFSPNSAPAMPASAAEVTNAISLYFVTFTPMASAAMRLSRLAIIARPERLLMRFSTTNSVSSTSTKPASNVAMRPTRTAPAGPLYRSVPSMRGLLKLTISLPSLTAKYRQFMTLRMISPNASVTMAR